MRLAVALWCNATGCRWNTIRKRVTAQLRSLGEWIEGHVAGCGASSRNLERIKSMEGFAALSMTAVRLDQMPWEPLNNPSLRVPFSVPEMPTGHEPAPSRHGEARRAAAIQKFGAKELDRFAALAMTNQ